jgi:phosphate transport system permease protein
MGRIIGDTAIIVVLLGATLQLQPLEDIFGPAGVLRGTGSTLTSYVYNNSPAGEGGAFEKAYAAAFVLLLIVIVLNLGVARIAGRRTALGGNR